MAASSAIDPSLALRNCTTLFIMLTKCFALRIFPGICSSRISGESIGLLIMLPKASPLVVVVVVVVALVVLMLVLVLLVLLPPPPPPPPQPPPLLILAPNDEQRRWYSSLRRALFCCSICRTLPPRSRTAITLWSRLCLSRLTLSASMATL
jgi:hypothetical protein